MTKERERERERGRTAFDRNQTVNVLKHCPLVENTGITVREVYQEMALF